MKQEEQERNREKCKSFMTSFFVSMAKQNNNKKDKVVML